MEIWEASELDFFLHGEMCGTFTSFSVFVVAGGGRKEDDCERLEIRNFADFCIYEPIVYCN